MTTARHNRTPAQIALGASAVVASAVASKLAKAVKAKATVAPAAPLGD